MALKMALKMRMKTDELHLLILEYGTVALAITCSFYYRAIDRVMSWSAAAPMWGVTLVCLLMLFCMEFDLLEVTGGTFVGWKFRVNATPGCWCCCLVPLVVAPLCFFQRTDMQLVLSIMSIALFASSVVFVQVAGFAALVKKPFQLPAILWQTAVFVGVGSVAISHFSSKDVWFSIIVSASTHGVFYAVFLGSQRAWPGSFTLGENIILSQAVALFTVSSIADVFILNSRVPAAESTQISAFCQVVLLGCELAVIIWLSTPLRKSLFAFHIVGFLVLVVFIVPAVVMRIEQNPVSWMLKFITASSRRMYLVSVWALLTACAIAIVALQQFRGKQASTVTRKIFHLLVVLVYFPGLYYDVELLRLASLMTFAIFILLESVRTTNLEPLGPLLNKTFSVFLDEKDSGPLVLTPIYLLLGCSVPIWLAPTTTRYVVAQARLSGVLFLGVGDSAASVGGTMFGYRRWPGTKKTLEGTLTGILSQVAVFMFVLQTGWLFSWTSSVPLLRIVLAITLSSLLEAFTSQVDNLVIPLLTFFMFLSV